ncbi:hypothetical protein BSKO_05600 [Bryopsis sp. KO-2023]|nr:hypothetical protein BSKO_05600 [Bryopsis sp. KO-2023]
MQGQTSSFAQNGGSATTFATGISNGGELNLQADAVAKDGQTSEAFAQGIAEDGNRADAIARAIGSDNGGDVRAEAIAGAARDGQGNAIAIAVAKAVDGGKRTEAVSAIVEAHAVAKNRGEGTAFARAAAVGVVRGDEAARAYAEAISILVKDQGCANVKPILAEAEATAIADGKERNFVDAFDSFVGVSECLYSACDGERAQCCSQSGDKCKCENGNCAFSLFKSAPKKLWKCNSDCGESMCICN